MQLLRSLVAVVALISTTATAHAAATVTVLNERDTSISGVFACTNDPTWAVQLFSVATVERETGTGKVVTTFTSLSVVHYYDAVDQPPFEASGFSFEIGPRGHSVAGTFPLDVYSFPGGAVNAAFQFTFQVDASKPMIEGPFVSKQVYPDGTLVSHIVGQTHPATATGSITLTDGSAVVLDCRLQSISNPDSPTVIQSIREGTITITK